MKIKKFVYLVIWSLLFGDDSQVIQWHFAKYKDRYCIRPWIYYLIQCVTQENAVPPKLITQDQVIELPPIERKTALAQLETYVKDYLQSQIEIQLVPTVRNVNDFIVDDESAVDFDNISTKLQELGEDSNYGAQADPYWSRVLAQTSRFEQTGNIEKIIKTNKRLVWLIIRTKEDKKGIKLIVKEPIFC